MIRLILAGLALVLVALVGFVGYRTLSFTASPPPAEAAVPDLAAYAIDTEAAANRLAQAIGFPTVSLVSESDDRAPFAALHAWLQQTYPAFHAVAKREVFGEFSLLYTWAGSDPAQPPIVLTAHMDVVPAAADTLENWNTSPFQAVIRDGYIQGRGAIDDKGSLVALMEAVEFLAAQGRQPARTIILAFGHDEEIGGDQGAVLMSQALVQRGQRAWFVLDEGSAAIDPHPLTGAPAAIIAVAERGFATLRVRAVGQPGHSSTPPHETAVSLAAAAVDRIHSMPITRSLEGGPAIDMMRALAPEISFTTRMAVANEWLFGPLLRGRMEGDPVSRALMGTSVAPTMINGGVRPNVLPAEVEAMINFRLHPRDTSAEILARAQAAVADLEGVTVEWAEPPREATSVSSTTSSSYALIAAVTGAALDGLPAAPGLMLAGADARHYQPAAENVYRFQPMLFTTADLEGIHGLNERLSLNNFERTIRFYIGLIEAGAFP